MSVTIHLSCGGCDATAEGTRPLKSEFVSFSGRSYGFGSMLQEKATAVVPEGWIAFDPYTGCCYCPKCWALIVGDIEATP